MRRDDAIKKLRKLLGNRLGYQVDPAAPDADAREDARLQLMTVVRPRREELRTQVEQRCRAILAADEEYQRLKADLATTSKRHEELVGITSHYRFTAGTMGQFFFSVAAQGDSWEEVIALVQEKKRKGQLT